MKLNWSWIQKNSALKIENTKDNSKMSVAALDSVMDTQVAQLNLLLYQIYRPYFNGKPKLIIG